MDSSRTFSKSTMGIFAVFVFLALVSSSSAQDCCDSCKRDVISLNRQLTDCLKTLTERKLHLKITQTCVKTETITGKTCAENLLIASRSLGNCLESLCQDPPARDSKNLVNLTLVVGDCKGATTYNNFSVALAKLDGPKLLWMSSFAYLLGHHPRNYHTQVELVEHDPEDATHVVFDFKGRDQLMLDRIIMENGDGAQLSFAHERPQELDKCCGSFWIAGNATQDKDCDAYLGPSSYNSFALFGHHGIDYVFNKADFGKLKANKFEKIEELHRSCNACAY
ncbi:hypothetical protein L596_030455 [Steinernema carpocapsae]|uniref:Saposin B-type domain-containing protein n=1 Tax=Steinernema carpocapsae TaxID=34508 RepID=A0A4V5ZX12_STECR|nr:hypothetical protein L596_030455 [Steinernema carpocapsae]